MSSLPQESPVQTSCISREGIPFQDYNWLALIPALMVGSVITFAQRMVRLTVREKLLESADVPENAIICLYHREAFVYPIAHKTWGSLKGEVPMAWLGYHGFLSYIGLEPYISGLRCFRYKYRSNERPFQQTIRFLKENPHGRFAIRTDAGGPYGKVRRSIVDMSLATNRPVTCVRQSASLRIMILKHSFPLPFATIKTKISHSISAAELRALPIDEARLMIQKLMDSIEAV